MRFLGIFLFLIFLSVPAFAKNSPEKLDRDGDGFKESMVYYEADAIVTILVDRDKNGKYEEKTDYTYGPDGKLLLLTLDKQRGDGKPDYWKHYKAGAIYMREWDRNFDGKPDLRSYESLNHVTEKQYDDNFDGVFEKKWNAPKKGSSGRIKTSPFQQV